MPHLEEFTQFRADVSPPSAEARERTGATVRAAIEAELHGSAEPRVGRAGLRRSPFRRRPLRQPTEDEAERLRGLLREGLLRVAGPERLDGRRVIRLVASRYPDGPDGTTLVVLVDAETFLPVSVRDSFPCLSVNDAGECSPGDNGALDGTTSYSRYRVFEVLPASPETLAQLGMRPHPGATPVSYPDSE